MTLHIVPFTKTQELIQKQIPENYTMTATRRLMLQIADRIREQRKGLALITGESLGQVASQTLESMYAINAVTSTPILRPLIGMDKTEIIEKSREIGTYDTSIQPFEDCCTIFTPPSPKTRPKKKKLNTLRALLILSRSFKKRWNKLKQLNYTASKKQTINLLSFFKQKQRGTVYNYQTFSE